MNDKTRSDLWNLYHGLVDVAKETIDKLGEEQAWSFVELSNDWMDIFGALSKAYQPEDLLSSLVHADFTGLHQLLRWEQLHFLAGNYAALYRDLRFAWEMMLRAYYADTYNELNPDHYDGPAATVEGKIDWLEDRESKHKLGWHQTLEPTLRQVFPPTGSVAEVRDYYTGLWGKLNEFVHPSREFRYRMICEQPHQFIEAFDQKWAKEGLSVTTGIFDIIWLTVLGRFPESATLLSGKHAFALCPLTKRIVQSMHEP